MKKAFDQSCRSNQVCTIYINKAQTISFLSRWLYVQTITMHSLSLVFLLSEASYEASYKTSFDCSLQKKPNQKVKCTSASNKVLLCFVSSGSFVLVGAAGTHTNTGSYKTITDALDFLKALIQPVCSTWYLYLCF